MKRLIAFAFALAFILITVTSCGSSPASSTSVPAVPAPSSENASADSESSSGGSAPTRYKDPVYLSVYANSPGGSFYSIAAAYQPLWDRLLNVSVTIMPGGSTENYKAISRGDADMGFTHHTITYMGKNGVAPFDKPYEDVCAIAPVTPAAVQLIVLSNSPIQDLSEIGNKNVGFGTVGATANAFIIPYLEEEYGITPESIAANGGSVSYLSDSEVTTALQDGQVDIALAFGIYPKPNIQEIENTPGIRLIPLDEAKLDDFISKNPQWSKYYIPANSYVGQTEQVCSVAAYAIISCSNKLDEELVYNLTKVMWEYQSEAADSSTEVANWMHIEDVPAIIEAAPLHPGAERYYKELGIL
ncbi:TAXI family TRAP transporter solute-binding subunit [Faecalicatena sp. BF-R-105]|nr:TAXI family TRAP transporter solute-binding subunit [Faecalicatena sp. BF-R-105]